MKNIAFEKKSQNLRKLSEKNAETPESKQTREIKMINAITRVLCSPAEKVMASLVSNIGRLTKARQTNQKTFVIRLQET